MAENPNVGVAVFVADNTSMCGLGSDGAAAFLSACSLVPGPNSTVVLYLPGTGME